MFDGMPVQDFAWFRAKYFAFAAIAVMTAYVFYHNERFLLDSAHPVWQHYASFKWWLLPHALAGACALLLAPMQFSDGLRKRFTKLHRITGRTYVACTLIFAPVGAYIQYLEEPLGVARSFTVATAIFAAILMTTTCMGLIFALTRNIPQHRQWMTRSYAVALVFFEVRVILGVTGWDVPPNAVLTEAVVWSCLALSVLIGDIANQLYEWPRRTARAQAAETLPVGLQVSVTA